MRRWTLALALAGPWAWGGAASAHVPYFERQDYSRDRPFGVHSVTQSIAVYAWLSVRDGRSDDVDVYRFKLRRPTRVYVHVIVPVLKRHKDFRPVFAVVGPGLPQPDGPLPFAVPEGHGVVLIEYAKEGGERPTFYEPFGGKSYFKGPVFDRELKEAGEYFVCFWDPDQKGGDYVAVLGYRETWGLLDIIRALIHTPLIRLGWELHDEADEVE